MSNLSADVKEQLEAIKQVNNQSEKKKILILGAGVSGLVCGYELSKLGHEVKIIEGSSRIGGRVWTHRFKNGQYGELGAMRIPASHDYTRHYTSNFGLKLRKFVNSNKNCFYDINNQTSTMDNFSRNIGTMYRLSQRDYDDIVASGHEKIFIRIIGNIIDNLSLDEKTQLFDKRITSDKLKRLDQLSLFEFLKRNCDNIEALKFCGISVVLNDYWDKSLLMFIREEIDEAFSGLEEIIGGTDLLVKGFLESPINNNKKLKDIISTKTEVVDIKVKNNSVSVSVTSDNSQNEIEFPYVICTIPFSVLRKINIEGIGLEKKEAINNLSYHSATKVLLNFNRRFWETEKDIYGGSSLSDTILKQTYYPSDNAITQDPNVSNGPGVMLGCYSWGQASRALGLLKQEEIYKLVLKNISRFHPNVEDHITTNEEEKPYAIINWDSYKWALGAFASPKPLDISIFSHNAQEPEGRLFFAGEHLSPYPSWIQGALWSGLQSVISLLKYGKMKA